MEQQNEYAEMKKLYAALLKDMETGEDGSASSAWDSSQSGMNRATRVSNEEFFYRILEKLKYIILFAVLIAAAVWAVSTYLITPKYSATSKIYIMSNQNRYASVSDYQIGVYLTGEYEQIFYNRAIHEKVKNNLGLSYSPGELQSMLEIIIPDGTRLLCITVKGKSPQEVCMIANEYSTVVREFIATTLMPKTDPALAELYGDAASDPSAYITEFERANIPGAPVSPNIRLNTVLGFLGGAMVAFIFFALKFLLDDKIRSDSDLENSLGIPSLGLVPIEKKSGRNRKNRNQESTRETKAQPRHSKEPKS